MVIGWLLRVGITENNVCLAAYHWQMDFSMHRQCFSSETASDGHTPYKARPSQNWPNITTYDHFHQIFITSRTWFRHGVLGDWGLSHWQNLCFTTLHHYIIPFIAGGSFHKIFWQKYLFWNCSSCRKICYEYYARTQGSNKNLRKKFYDISMTSPGQNPNFQTKKIPIFVFAAHVSICRINYRQTQTHTHIHNLIKANWQFNWFY